MGKKVANEMDDLVAEYLKTPKEATNDKRLKLKQKRIEQKIKEAGERYGEDDIPEELTDSLDKIKSQLENRNKNESLEAVKAEWDKNHKRWLPRGAKETSKHNWLGNIKNVQENTDLWGRVGEDNYLTGEWNEGDINENLDPDWTPAKPPRAVAVGDRRRGIQQVITAAPQKESTADIARKRIAEGGDYVRKGFGQREVKERPQIDLSSLGS